MTQYGIKTNENDISNKNSNSNSFLDLKDLKKLKKEIYSDFEKINLKILNELKNQAYDIKSIYQELQVNGKISIKNSINTEEDLLNENIKFSTNNWLYSIKKLTNFEAQSSPYINIQDLKLKMLTTSDKIADLSQYIQPVLIKYFVQWIDNYNLNLIVNSTNFGFSDISAFIENEEHKLQKITDNLFSLDYNNIIENNLEIYSSGSRFKMIIQLL
jgi:hypothetical protein